MTGDEDLPSYATTRPTRDFDAFFLERYGPLVRSLGLAFGDREAAADAAQEAFVRAYARWWRIKRLDNPGAWVRRVAVNLLVDDIRRRGPRERAFTKVAHMTPQTVAGPESAYDHDLVARLEALPQQQRLAVTLFYLDDLSVAEVAETMSLSTGAVKYHLNQARNHLRGLLAEDRV